MYCTHVTQLFRWCFRSLTNSTVSFFHSFILSFIHSIFHHLRSPHLSSTCPKLPQTTSRSLPATETSLELPLSSVESSRLPSLLEPGYRRRHRLGPRGNPCLRLRLRRQHRTPAVQVSGSDRREMSSRIYPAGESCTSYG